MFYISGAYGLLWLFFWWLVVSDQPADNGFISEAETEHILANRQQDIGNLRGVTAPYLRILLNPVVWVITICDFTISLASYIVIIEGPNFIDNILHKDISSNGVLSAVPHAVSILYAMVFGSLSDTFAKRGILSKRGIRQLFHGIGFGIPAIASCVLGYTTNNWILCICVMSFGHGFRAAQYAGHYQVPYDISPKFSGTVFGYINTIASSSGFITTFLSTAFIGEDPTDVTGWRKMFLLSGGLCAASLFLFLIFAKFDPVKFDTDFDKETCKVESNQTNYKSIS